MGFNSGFKGLKAVRDDTVGAHQGHSPVCA